MVGHNKHSGDFKYQSDLFFCDFNKILILNCKSSKPSYRVKKKIQSEFSIFCNIFSIFIVLIAKHYNTQHKCPLRKPLFLFVFEFTITDQRTNLSTYICAIHVKLFIAKISFKNICVTFLRPRWCAAKPSPKLLI